MSPIETLFGIDASAFKPLCIVTPYLTHHLRKALGINEIIKGKIYHCAQLPHATLIKSGVGASLTGDCILWLEDTPCEKIIFFGSAGAVSTKHRVGSLVTVSDCFAADGFSSLMADDIELMAIVETDKKLTHSLFKEYALPEVKALSFASLKLEEDYLDIFKEHNIDVIDMECAAALNAAERIDVKSSALLYITDMIGLYPFWQSLRNAERPEITQALDKAAAILMSPH